MTNLTVDLETAKRLKELGWSKKCVFSQNVGGKPCMYEMFPDYELPTAQELLDVLPNFILYEKHYFRLHIYSLDIMYVGYYFKNDISLGNSLIVFDATNGLANALGQLTIRLIENGYLSFNDDND